MPEHFKKVIAASLVIFISLSFALMPASGAYAAVPTFDVGLNPQVEILNSMIASIHQKEVGTPPVPPAFLPNPLDPCGVIDSIIFGGLPALDCIARALAELMLSNLTESLVGWLKTGNLGARKAPLYVDNFVEHFRREIDNATGLFLEAYLDPEFFDLLCKPFRIPVATLIGSTLQRPNFAVRARCTLNDIIENLENFHVDFTQGGWEAWEALIFNDDSNWMGAYLTGVEEATELQAEALLEAEEDVETTSGGFLGDRECDETEEGFLVDCVVVTPGELVEKTAQEVFGIEVDELEAADELDEVLAAIFDEIISWSLTGGGGFADFGEEEE